MKWTPFRRRLARTFALALATAAVLVTVASAQLVDLADGVAQPRDEQTIGLVTKDGSTSFVDNPPKSKTGRVSAGDLFVFTSKAFAVEGDALVGTSHGACLATHGGKDFDHASFLCNGAFALDDGIVAWSWAGGGNQPLITLAVTGGTEAYEGASGSVRSEARADGTSLETIHLLP